MRSPAYTQLTLTFFYVDLPSSSDAACAGCCRAIAGQAVCHARPTFGMGNGSRIGAQYSRTQPGRRLSQLDALLSVLLGGLVWLERRQAFTTALPILALWGCNRAVSSWLNRPPATGRNQTSRKNVAFLRHAALRTWRYFSEYSTAEHNWLIPDNVQEEPPAVAARVSPTNIGLLLTPGR